MAELTSLQASEELVTHMAPKMAERLRAFEPTVTPPEEVQDAVRTLLALANLTLSAWEAVQQLINKGIEGGQARLLVGKVRVVVEAWLANVRIAVHSLHA